AAVTLPVLRGTEDLLAEQPILLGLQRAVVDRLRLLHLAVRPGTDLVGCRERDRELCGVVHVEHWFPRLSLFVFVVFVFIVFASVTWLFVWLLTRVACGCLSRRAVDVARLPRRCRVRAATGRCRATRWYGTRPRRARGSPPLRPPRSSRGRSGR